MTKTLIVDGRNSSVKPHTILMDSEELSRACVKSFTDPISHNEIYCLNLEGKYVPCLKYKDFGEYKDCGVFCAEYKTIRGFNAWLARFYPAIQL